MARWVLFLAATLVGAGCAQQVARKVPLVARMNDCDEHVKGFRYYLSRPYIVVSKRIPIRTDLDLAALCWAEKSGNYVPALLPARSMSGHEAKSGPYEIIPPDGTVQFAQLYDLQGKELGDARFVRFYDKEEPLPPAVHATAKIQERRPSDVLMPSLLYSVATDTAPPDEVEPPPFQVVFLPDFEEQMAVDNKSHLAYGKFELHFRDGWQLSSTKGTWDSTEVAVRMLQSVSNAISAAATVQKTALEKLPLTAPANGANALESLGKGYNAVVIVRRKWYIEPGLYRVQKSWETQGEESVDEVADGLLSSLGLPTVSEIELTLAE